MLDDFFELFRDYRQDSQIRRLQRRLETLSAVRSHARPERNMAAAVVRLLLKKGLITADELADEMEAINEEQFAKARELTPGDRIAFPGGTVDAAKIAELDTSDDASEIRPDEK